MALYTRKLKSQERKTIESHLDTPEEDLPAHRLQIIMLSAEGKRVPEISEEVNLHPINVRKWIHRFNRYGLDGLRSGKSPGRPPVFSDDQRNQIIEVANTNPRLLGMHYYALVAPAPAPLSHRAAHCGPYQCRDHPPDSAGARAGHGSARLASFSNKHLSQSGSL